MSLKNREIKCSKSFLLRVIPAKAGIHGVNSSRNPVHFSVDSRLRGNDKLCNQSVFLALSFIFLFSILSISTPHTLWAEQPQEGEAGGGCFPCNAGNPCDDGNTCTDDKCVDQNCVFTPNNELCDDGNSCTEDERCVDGVCQGDTVTECPEDNDGNPCTELECQPGSGCVPANVGGNCNDGKLCTIGDNCVDGACVGSPRICDDGDPCTTNRCDAQTGGCVFSQPAAADSCSQTKECTGNLNCDFATCTCKPPCPENGQCTAGFCPDGTNCKVVNGQCKCEQPCAAKLGKKITGAQCDGICPDNQGCNPLTCSCITCPPAKGPDKGRCILPCPGGSICGFDKGQCVCKRNCTTGPLQDNEICVNNCPNKVNGVKCLENCTCEQPCAKNLGAPQAGVQCDGVCPEGLRCDGNCNCVACPDAGNNCPKDFCPQGTVCTVNGNQCKCEQPCNANIGRLLDGAVCTGECPNQDKGVVCDKQKCACIQPCTANLPQKVGQCFDNCGINEACNENCNCIQCPIGDDCNLPCPGGKCFVDKANGGKCKCERLCNLGPKQEGELCIEAACPDQDKEVFCDKNVCSCLLPCDAGKGPPGLGVQCKRDCPEKQACNANCNCVACPVNGQCPAGFCPDGSKCAIDANNQCSCSQPCAANIGKVLDGAKCDGICPAKMECNPNTCTCEQPCDADVGQLLEGAKLCKDNCPKDKGKACDKTCKCAVCPLDGKCPAGFCPDGSDCVVANNQCSCSQPCTKNIGKVLDGAKCDGVCPAKMKCNPDNCTCEQPCDADVGQLLDGAKLCKDNCPKDKGKACDKTCKCAVCPLDGKCPAGFCPDGSDCVVANNQCSCSQPCTANLGKVIDGAKCDGKCPDKMQCNANTCTCEQLCDANVGQLLEGAKQCKPNCPAGKACDKTCKCAVCPLDGKCPAGFCPDGTDCVVDANNKCVCSQPCTKNIGKVLNGAKCDGVCPAKMKCNPDNCTCEQPCDADVGQLLDGAKLCKKNCPAGKVCDDTCKCVECLKNGDCPNKDCQVKSCKDNKCVYDKAEGAQCGAPGLVCPEGAACNLKTCLCQQPCNANVGQVIQGAQCKPNCPDANNPKNKFCLVAQCKCVECLAAANCPDRVCQKKVCNANNNRCEYENIGNCGPGRACPAGVCQNCECVAQPPGPGPGFPFPPRPGPGGGGGGGFPPGGGQPQPQGGGGGGGQPQPPFIQPHDDPSIIGPGVGGCPKWGDDKAHNEHKLPNEKDPNDPWVRDENGNRIPTGYLCKRPMLSKCLSYCPGTPPIDPVVGCGYGNACPRSLCKDRCDEKKGESHLKNVPCDDSNKLCCATVDQERGRLDKFVDVDGAREGVVGCKDDFCKDDCGPNEAHTRRLTCKDRTKKCCAKLKDSEVCNADLCKDKCRGDETHIRNVQCADRAKKCCMKDDDAANLEKDLGCSKCFRRKIAATLNRCFAMEFKKDAAGNLILDPETDQPIPQFKRWADGTPMKAEEGDDCYVEETKCVLVAKRNERKQLVDKDGQPINPNDPDIGKKKVYECKQKRGVGKCGRETDLFMTTLPLYCQHVVCKGPDIGYKDCPENKACRCGNGIVDKELMNPDKPEMVLYKEEQCDHGKLVNGDPKVDCPGGGDCDNECQCAAICPVGGVIVAPSGEEEREAWHEKLAEWLGEKSAWAAEESDIPADQWIYAQADLCDAQGQFDRRIIVAKDSEDLVHVYTGIPGSMKEGENLVSLKDESGINISFQGHSLIISKITGIWLNDKPLNPPGRCAGSPPVLTTQPPAPGGPGQPTAPGAPGPTPGQAGTPGEQEQTGTPYESIEFPPPDDDTSSLDIPPPDSDSPAPVISPIEVPLKCPDRPRRCNQDFTIKIYNGQRTGPEPEFKKEEVNRWFKVEVDGATLSKEAGNARYDGLPLHADTIEEEMIPPEKTLEVTIPVRSLCQQGKPYIDYKVRCLKVCGSMQDPQDPKNHIFICDECKELCSGRIPCCLCGNGRVNDNLYEQCDPGSSPDNLPNLPVEEQCAQMRDDCAGRDCSCNENCQCVPPPKCEMEIRCGKNLVETVSDIRVPMTEGKSVKAYEGDLCKQYTDECCTDASGNTQSSFKMEIKLMCTPEEDLCAEVECPCPCQYKIEEFGSCIERPANGTVGSEALVQTTVSVIDGNSYQCPAEPVTLEMNVVPQVGSMIVDLPSGIDLRDWPVDQDVSIPIELSGTGVGLPSIGGCFIGTATIGDRRPPLQAVVPVVFVDTRPFGTGVRTPTYTVNGQSGVFPKSGGECPSITCHYKRRCEYGDRRLSVQDSVVNVEVDFEGVSVTGTSGNVTFSLSATEECPFKCPDPSKIISELSGKASVSIPLTAADTATATGEEPSPCTATASANYECERGPEPEYFSCLDYLPSTTEPPEIETEIVPMQLVDTQPPAVPTYFITTPVPKKEQFEEEPTEEEYPEEPAESIDPFMSAEESEQPTTTPTDQLPTEGAEEGTQPTTGQPQGDQAGQQPPPPTIPPPTPPYKPLEWDPELGGGYKKDPDVSFKPKNPCPPPNWIYARITNGKDQYRPVDKYETDANGNVKVWFKDGLGGPEIQKGNNVTLFCGPPMPEKKKDQLRPVPNRSVLERAARDPKNQLKTYKE